MKHYEAPQLFVDEYAADTMIASTGPADAKNGNAGDNQNCWGCKESAGALDPGNSSIVCTYEPGDGAYEAFC